MKIALVVVVAASLVVLSGCAGRSTPAEPTPTPNFATMTPRPEPTPEPGLDAE